MYSNIIIIIQQSLTCDFSADKTFKITPASVVANEGATSIRLTFKSSKNEKLFNASKEFHISDYLIWLYFVAISIFVV